MDSIEHKDVIETFTVDAQTTNCEKVLADHEAGCIDTPGYLRHLGHYNAIVLARIQTQLPKIVLEISHGAYLPTFALLLASKNVNRILILVVLG